MWHPISKHHWWAYYKCINNCRSASVLDFPLDKKCHIYILMSLLDSQIILRREPHLCFIGYFQNLFWKKNKIKRQHHWHIWHKGWNEMKKKILGSRKHIQEILSVLMEFGLVGLPIGCHWGLFSIIILTSTKLCLKRDKHRIQNKQANKTKQKSPANCYFRETTRV